MFNIYEWLTAAKSANKTDGLKFWSPAYGVMTFYMLNPDFNDIACKTTEGMVVIFDSFGRLCKEGDVVLFPINDAGLSFTWNAWQKAYFKVGDYISYSSTSRPLVITEIDNEDESVTIIDEDGDKIKLADWDYFWASRRQIYEFKSSLKEQGFVYNEADNKLMLIGINNQGEVCDIRKYIVGEKIKNITTGMKSVVKSFDKNSMILENNHVVENYEGIENDWVPDYNENDIVILYDEKEPNVIWITVVGSIEKNDRNFEIRSKYSSCFFNNELDFESCNGWDIFTEFTETREATEKELQMLQQAIISSKYNVPIDEIEKAIADVRSNRMETSNKMSNMISNSQADTEKYDLMRLWNTLTDEQKAVLIDIIKSITKLTKN